MQFLPIILTTIAGLSTLLGLLFIYIPVKRVEKIVSLCLSFSAGVIISICLFDLIPHSTLTLLEESRSSIITFLFIILFFLFGYFLIFLFKKIKTTSPTELYRVGVIAFLILFFHNTLEGIATYSSAVYDINIGLHFTLAIIMHNIPEGILICVPIYYSTKNKIKAFKLVLFSGIAEPMGAIISYLLFKNIYTDVFIGYLMIIIAGLMLSLIINEIIPEIRKYSVYKWYNVLFIMIGGVFILINLFLF